MGTNERFQIQRRIHLPNKLIVPNPFWPHSCRDSPWAKGIVCYHLQPSLRFDSQGEIGSLTVCPEPDLGEEASDLQVNDHEHNSRTIGDVTIIIRTDRLQ